jgi:hypothetical protein
MVTENDQHMEAEADRRHHEQIHRGDAGGVVGQKGLPARARRPSAMRRSRRLLEPSDRGCRLWTLPIAE